MKGELMRAVLVPLLAAATSLTIAGCASRRPSSAPPQIPPRQPVVGLCKSPAALPADVANKPGYHQFDVSVTDASGQPIPGLTQKDFVVFGQSRIFPVTYFRENHNDEPLAIALVIDTSGSMVPKLPVVKQSLGSFVTKLNRCDEVILFTFSDRPYLLMPFSTDHQITARRLELLHAYGQTALYDAAKIALQNLASADYPNRKIILITDGIDSSSSTTRPDVVAQAGQDDVPIYAVGIGDPRIKETRDVAIGPYIFNGLTDKDRVDAKSLQDLSASAGGRSFIVPAKGPNASEDFEDAIAAIAASVGSGYAIGAVIPADIPSSSVYVTIVKRLDAVVRAHPIAAPH